MWSLKPAPANPSRSTRRTDRVSGCSGRRGSLVATNGFPLTVRLQDAVVRAAVGIVARAAVHLDLDRLAQVGIERIVRRIVLTRRLLSCPCRCSRRRRRPRRTRVHVRRSGRDVSHRVEAAAVQDGAVRRRTACPHRCPAGRWCPRPGSWRRGTRSRTRRGSVRSIRAGRCGRCRRSVQVMLLTDV